MTTFRQYLRNGNHQMLKEGGAAVPDVTRINQLNVESTVKDILDRLVGSLTINDISPDDIRLIGSTGKKDPSNNGTPTGSSGDIDMACRADKDKLLPEIGDICKKLNYDFKYLAGLGITSVSWPITNTDGKQPDEKVQLDVIPVNNIEYVSWSYYSPRYDESEFKGLFRNECLFYIARNTGYEVTEYKNEIPVTWNRYFLDLGKGLFKGVQTRYGKRGNVIKTVSTVSKKFVSDDPEEIVHLLFGPSFESKNLMTFEQVLSAMENTKFNLYDKRHELYKYIADGIENKRQPIPKVLNDLLGR